MQNLPFSRSLDKKAFDFAKRVEGERPLSLPLIPIGLTKPFKSEPIASSFKLARTPNCQERADSIEGISAIYTTEQDSARKQASSNARFDCRPQNRSESSS